MPWRWSLNKKHTEKSLSCLNVFRKLFGNALSQDESIKGAFDALNQVTDVGTNQFSSIVAGAEAEVASRTGFFERTFLEEITNNKTRDQVLEDILSEIERQTPLLEKASEEADDFIKELRDQGDIRRLNRRERLNQDFVLEGQDLSNLNEKEIDALFRRQGGVIGERGQLVFSNEGIDVNVTSAEQFQILLKTVKDIDLPLAAARAKFNELTQGIKNSDQALKDFLDSIKKDLAQLKIDTVVEELGQKLSFDVESEKSFTNLQGKFIESERSRTIEVQKRLDLLALEAELDQKKLDLIKEQAQQTIKQTQDIEITNAQLSKLVGFLQSTGSQISNLSNAQLSEAIGNFLGSEDVIINKSEAQISEVTKQIVDLTQERLRGIEREEEGRRRILDLTSNAALIEQALTESVRSRLATLDLENEKKQPWKYYRSVTPGEK